MFGTGLVITLPGALTMRLNIPGSVYRHSDIRDAVMPVALRAAIDLLLREAGKAAIPVHFVARPEIFTDGRSRAWLDERLGAVSDHVALSDGTSFRPISGLRNHFFFYARGSQAGSEALRYLVQVAPELFAANCTSQINGSLAFRAGARSVLPPQVQLLFEQTPPGPPGEFLPFYCNPASPEESATRCLEATAQEELELPAAGRLCFIPLSENAMADTIFMRVVAKKILATMFARNEIILLELPALGQFGAGAKEQIASILRSLSQTGSIFPRQISHSVLMTTAAPTPARLTDGSILLHPSVPFWRYGLDFYRAVRKLEVASGAPARGFARMISGWVGQDAEYIDPSAVLGHSRIVLGRSL